MEQGQFQHSLALGLVLGSVPLVFQQIADDYNPKDEHNIKILFDIKQERQ